MGVVLLLEHCEPFRKEIIVDFDSQKKFFQTAYDLKEKRLEKGYGWPLEVDPQLIEFLKEIKKTKSCGRALDLGCGQGRHAIYFAENGFYSYGIDYIESAVEEARQKALEKGVKNVTFAAIDVLNLNFPYNFFDIILDWSVLDHIKPKDWSAYVFSIYNILKSGGYLILTEFSANDERMKDKPNNFFEDEDHYDHYFKIDEIAKLFNKNFEIIKTNELLLESEPKHLMLNVLLKKK